MNRNEALSQSSLLREMIRVKKLRFKDIEDRKLRPRVTNEYLKRRANFEEFKAVYGDCAGRGGAPDKECAVHKTKSGSFFKVPRVAGKPEHVETVNLELPLHYGGDRAVQLIENKIKPKRASNLPKISREVITEPPKKPKKTVTIVETLKTIEEVATIEKDISDTTLSNKQLKEIEKHLSMRKERIQKNLPKPPLPRTTLKKKTSTNGKLMSTLSSINHKLKTMQDKYFSAPKVQYRAVNDCFTQSGNVEVFFENKHFDQEEVRPGVRSEEGQHPVELWDDSKMQDRIKEMQDLFPEFPKIEDTLRQIEGHLEDIAKNEAEIVDNPDLDKLENDTKIGRKMEKIWSEGNLDDILDSLDEPDPIEDSLTQEILKSQNQLKNQKLKSISHQIDHVEDFCDKISSILNDDAVDADTNRERANRVKAPQDQLKHIEGPDLESTIKKSDYLSRELRDFRARSGSQPEVKIFSENKRSFWKDRLREIREQKAYSVESVTKMIDALKFTLENSIYEPVT